MHIEQIQRPYDYRLMKFFASWWARSGTYNIVVQPRRRSLSLVSRALEQSVLSRRLRSMLVYCLVSVKKTAATAPVAAVPLQSTKHTNAQGKRHQQQLGVVRKAL